MRVDLISHKERRLKILELTSREYGCLCNAEWAKAATDEPDMKWLIKRGLVELKRKLHNGWGRKYTRFTKAFITEKGKEFLKNPKKSS